MTGMDDLATWLRAQLDADEIEINRHPDGHDDYLGGDLVAREEQNYPAAPYLAMSKARALAELDAKRRILDECDSMINGWTHEETKDYGRDILRLLALPLAERPGYDESWRP